MNVGVTTSYENPNSTYFNSKGMWLTYILIVAFVHYILLSLPFLSVAMAWTLTNISHNVPISEWSAVIPDIGDLTGLPVMRHNHVMFIVLHCEKGTPFETTDQAKYRYLTVWEQMDYGVQFSASRKFLTLVPIVLFFLASFYTKYDPYHFGINAASLLVVLVAKLPALHGIRIFGINKY